MNTATDTFTEFVDHLASAMADGEAGSLDGHVVAARLCSSRSHFDRMIKHGIGDLGWGDPSEWVASSADRPIHR